MKKTIQNRLKESQKRNPSLKDLPVKSYVIDMSEIRRLFKNITKFDKQKILVK